MPFRAAVQAGANKHLPLFLPNLIHRLITAFDWNPFTALAATHIVFHGLTTDDLLGLKNRLFDFLHYLIEIRLTHTTDYISYFIGHQSLSAKMRAAFFFEVQRNASRSSSAVHSRSSTLDEETWNKSSERSISTMQRAVLLRSS